jgi:glycosyltransferase involved in cell wall biosynthesis
MLSHTTRIVFSTAWQKDIFEKAYGLDVSKNSIIENYYGGEKSTNTYSGGKKVFVAGTRVLKWKNIALLKEAFAEAQREVPDIELDLSNEPYEAFMKKIRASYSVILTSLGDISPNMILDALRHGTPAIFTRENGINNRIKDHVLLVNPQSKEDIVKAIKEIADPVKREEYKKKAEQFSFEHNWDNIAREFISLYEKIV